MEAYIQNIISQSLAFTLTLVMVISFLESLALVGLLLPGTVIMTSIGALIGGRKIDFYSAWAVSFVGCFLGDWVSYFIGRVFKKTLHGWAFLQKRQETLKKTESALHRHSMSTILVGRLIGPTRPLVPMIAGMFELPLHKFVLPNSIGCVLWPPIYFFPGILAGVAIDIPISANSVVFNWFFLLFVSLIWLAAWLSWRGWLWWSESKPFPDCMSHCLSSARLHAVCSMSWFLVFITGYWLSQEKQILVYRHLLWLVLSG